MHCSNNKLCRLRCYCITDSCFLFVASIINTFVFVVTFSYWSTYSECFLFVVTVNVFCVIVNYFDHVLDDC